MRYGYEPDPNLTAKTNDNLLEKKRVLAVRLKC